MLRASALTTALALLLVAPACDKDGASSQDPETEPTPGYSNASSADLSQIPPELEAGDIDGVQARAMVLWKMQRAMRLGDRAFAGFVGVTSAKFASLASIDPGASSGQVAYFKWEDEDLDDGDATAAEAQNWVLVSVTFDPDENLDPQEQGGKPQGETQRSLEALLLAQDAAKAEYPDARWVGYTFREKVMADGSPTGEVQTRVYMVGADDKSPDIEYRVLDPVKRKQTAKLVGSELQLPGASTSKLPLTTPAQSPGASTIARAVAIATVTKKPVKVVDASGTKWEVAPETGALSRL